VSSLPKSTRKQIGKGFFDPQLFLATVGVARTIYAVPKRTTKSSLKVIRRECFYIQQAG